MTIFEVTIFGFTLAPTYYGLMYALGIFLGAFILERLKLWTKEELEDAIMYIFFGIVIGGRLGYCLFYNPEYYLTNPVEILKIWEGGMSFHGGVIGSMVGVWLYNKDKFLENISKVALVAPIGIFFGRIGNYLNKELLGREYSGPLAVEVEGKTYFPSPLLEAFLEGLVLLIILFIVYKKRGIIREIGPLFLIGYSVFRFIAEFFRTPDAQLGHILLGLSMGQILSLIMLTIGTTIFIKTRQH